MISEVLDGLAAGDSSAAEQKVKAARGRALRALPDLRLIGSGSAQEPCGYLRIEFQQA